MFEFFDTAASYSRQISGILLNITVAILILLIGFIVGKLTGRFLKGAMHEAEIDSILSRAGFKINLEGKMSVVFEYTIYAAAVIIALNQMGIAATVLQALLLLVIALIIVFAFISLKDFLPNAIAGFLIHKKKLLASGDSIEIQGISGKVEDVGWVETKIINQNKDIVYIPNSSFLRSGLKVNRRKSKK